MTDLRNARQRRGLSLDEVSSQASIPRHYLVALERGDIHVLPQGRFRSGYHRQYRSFLGLPPTAEDLPTQAIARPSASNDSGHFGEYTGTTGTIPRHTELPTVRLIASGFAVTLLVVLVMRVGNVVMESPFDFGLPALSESPVETAHMSSVVMSAGTSSAATTATATATAALPAKEATTETAPAGPLALQRIKLRAIENVRVSVETNEGNIRNGILTGGESIEVESDGPIALAISDLTQVVVGYNGKRIVPLHNLSKGRRLVFVPQGAK